jgi:hypothetical protein
MYLNLSLGESMARSRRTTLESDEIPESVREGIHDHSIVLFGYLNLPAMPVHSGTGTLVTSGGKPYILTAHHCAQRLTEYDRICLPVRPGCPPLIIRRLDPIYVDEPKEQGWGPDLAFLPIHPIDVNNLKAFSHKIFYNLDRSGPSILRDPPKRANGMWSVLGAPAMLSKLKAPRELEIPLMAYKVTVKFPVENDGFDFMEICVPLDSANALPTFQGLSGGGLWHTEVARHADGTFSVIGSHRLVGCAFYETDAKRKYRYIRCHGWRSIYERGVSKLA